MNTNDNRDEHLFVGKEGAHNIRRRTCRNCEYKFEEMHYSCCGYASNGFLSYTNVCPTCYPSEDER
jgi:hypothetical protein